jgi:SAM-dependent methyltransferase
MLPQLLQTREAFDSVAADYDGPRGNNALVQDMRAEVWRVLDATFPAASRLIDIGCGTGLDAVRMARAGHDVTATDWSPRMIESTRNRAAGAQLTRLVHPSVLGAHELSCLGQPGAFDGMYSNLGALNCVPDLAGLARQCARLLKPGGTLVFAVIGRVCPWEIAHYARKRNWRRIRVRFAAEMVPVSMNGRVVWTHYYTPREFYAPFEPSFTLRQYRGMCVLAPPPYLTAFRERRPRLYERLWRLERRSAAWPGVRNLGDHFLIVMTKREEAHST